MIGNGIPMDEIAGQLGLSVKTIETYMNRIEKTLGIKSRMRLLMFAVEAITNLADRTTPSGAGPVCLITFRASR